MGGSAAAWPVRHDGRAGFTIVPQFLFPAPIPHIIMNLSRKYLLWWQVLCVTVSRLTSAMQLERYGGGYKILPASWSKAMGLYAAIDAEGQARNSRDGVDPISTRLIPLEGGFGSVIATVNVLR